MTSGVWCRYSLPWFMVKDEGTLLCPYRCFLTQEDLTSTVIQISILLLSLYTGLEVPFNMY